MAFLNEYVNKGCLGLTTKPVFKLGMLKLGMCDDGDLCEVPSCLGEVFTQSLGSVCY